MNEAKVPPAELAEVSQDAWHRLQREKLRERQRVAALEGTHFETIRGVAVPVRDGMSPLAKDLARKKQMKLLREDDRKLARMAGAIKKAKLGQPTHL